MLRQRKNNYNNNNKQCDNNNFYNIIFKQLGSREEKKKCKVCGLTVIGSHCRFF